METDSLVTKEKGIVAELVIPRPPRVSVVIPLYNKANSIGAALSSVLKQTVTDIEAVIVDDGSTDGSGDVVRGFSDVRLRLLEQANAGRSAARNRGIAEARSDMVAFVDADDVWFPHFLETTLALRDRFPEAGAYATAYLTRLTGQVRRNRYVGISHLIEGELLESYFRSCTLGASMMSSSSVMIPKRVFERVGDFPVGVGSGEDLHMWARIALEYPVAWSTLECAVWNLDAENRVAAHGAMYDAPFAGLLEDAIAQGRVPAGQAQWVKAYIAKYRVHYAAVRIANGDRRHGMRLLWLARGARGRRREWWKTTLRACAPTWLLGLRD